MKKIIFAVCLVSLGAVACKAQTTTSKDGGKYSIGIEAFRQCQRLFEPGHWWSLKYEYPVGANTFVSLSGGYTDLLYKSELKDDLKAAGINKSGEGFIPVKAGLKYYFSGGFFGEAQAGAVFSR